MVSASKMRKVIGQENRYDFDMVGLSTDKKPVVLGGYKAAVNSLFFEADTKDLYYLKSIGADKVLFGETTIVGESTEDGYVYNGSSDPNHIDQDELYFLFDNVLYSYERFDISLIGEDITYHSYGDDVQFALGEIPFTFRTNNKNDDIEIRLQDDESHSIKIFVENQKLSLEIASDMWSKYQYISLDFDAYQYQGTPITADEVYITWNNTTYICDKVEMDLGMVDTDYYYAPNDKYVEDYIFGILVRPTVNETVIITHKVETVSVTVEVIEPIWEKYGS